MSTRSKIWAIVLLSFILGVLIINVRYLYTTPVVNSWVWWRGDETWLMSQYAEFVRTGHYTNPLAPGSAFAQNSGILFGSCYLTASFYGLPLFFVHGHTIEIGRTISWLFGIAVLAVLWSTLRRYQISLILSLTGVLLLASTLCFFVTSHGARYDILVGLTILLLTGYLPLLIEKNRTSLVILGLLLPFSLLINGHVLVHVLLMLGYLLWIAGGFASVRSFLLWAGVAFGGIAIICFFQWILLGSFSIMGPFTGASAMIPAMGILHPKSDLANLAGRLHVANLWAPGVVVLAIIIAITLIGKGAENRIWLSRMAEHTQRLIISAALVIIADLLFEFYQDRYFIYVLPTIILAFIVLISELETVLHGVPAKVFAFALAICIGFSLWHYWTNTARLARTSEAIATANSSAMHDALATIHSHYPGHPRIFASVAGQAMTMDDSCDLITPVMYMQPNEGWVTREELWRRANINYAITFTTKGGGDWDENDSTIEWSARSNAKIIFQRVGPFTDIVRAYAPSDDTLVDTLRVYEFR